MVKKDLRRYFYLIPTFVLLILFVFYPIIVNIYNGFFEFGLLSPEKIFVGLRNYSELFKDSIFGTSLINNLVYVLISFVFQVIGGLIVAAILEDVIFRRVATFLRTIFFIPVLISMAVIGILFTYIYNPQAGLLNEFLNLIGLGSLTTGWLGNAETAIYAVIAVSQWQSVGYATMLYILALQKIPNELYEAATVDGAGKIKRFFYVTLPQAKEMMFVLSVYTITGSFLVFNEVYVLTGGGPANSSQVMSTYLFQKAFVDSEFGYGSSIANIMLILTLIFYAIQSKIFKTGKE